jgi:hypothetical protein
MHYITTTRILCCEEADAVGADVKLTRRADWILTQDRTLGL